MFDIYVIDSVLCVCMNENYHLYSLFIEQRERKVTNYRQYFLNKKYVLWSKKYGTTEHSSQDIPSLPMVMPKENSWMGDNKSNLI